jgi:hypothetical protein
VHRPLEAEVRESSDLLAQLSLDRQAHSMEVGRKVASVAELVPAAFRPELVTAALLHDIGYGHPVTGFHPLDGARLLSTEGFSPLICHLVAYHSLSPLEATVRGIDSSAFDEYAIGLEPQTLRRLNSVICWADMTTGPTGDTVRVEERLDDIISRYRSDDVVMRFIDSARPALLMEGQSPLSMYGSE